MSDPQGKQTHRIYESDTLHVKNVHISADTPDSKNSRGDQGSSSGQSPAGKVTGELVLRIIDRLKGI
jgi:hypothetical protein